MKVSKQNIFLSWSGERSKEIAIIFDKFLSDIFGNKVETWISTHSIKPGDNGAVKIDEGLLNSNFGIYFLTEENVESEWIHYELGAIHAAKYNAKNVKITIPYLLTKNIKFESGCPFNSAIQRTYSDKSGTYEIALKINKTLSDPQDNLLQAFEAYWPALNGQLESLRDEETHQYKTWKLRHICRSGIKSICDKSQYKENFLFEKLINAVASGISVAVNEYTNGDSPIISLPYIQYPELLLDLLRLKKTSVDAIAIVGDTEKFWDKEIAVEIQEATSNRSSRIFVFENRNTMQESMHILKSHAERYHVAAISFKRLSKQFPEFAKDFSIITYNEGKARNQIIAYYKEVTRKRSSNNQTRIIFDTTLGTIGAHETIFMSLWNEAEEIHDSTDEVEAVKKVFPESKVSDIKKEMSRYIPIAKYDKHEEEHAYYIEMMQTIVRSISSARESTDRIKILELGAGTGIFTKRLLAIQGADVTAVEIDCKCYDLLLQKKRSRKFTELTSKHHSTIECINDDSIAFANSSTKFDFIVSSFSDHHIHHSRKSEYLSNICRNLNKNGLFIVGDEFLPTYKKGSEVSYNRALKLYHNHIIDIAKEAGAKELIDLETAALNSGLEREGDFKISCKEYEAIITGNAQFSFEKNLIGPKNLTNIGGVYVYTLRKL